MTKIAVYGLKDPLKEGVVAALGICRRAGVNVRMVTGDNIDTATAIALEAGIIKRDEYDPDHIQPHQKYTCMTG